MKTVWRNAVAALLGACAMAAQAQERDREREPQPLTNCVRPPVLHLAVIPKNANSLKQERQASLLQALREATALPVQWMPAASYAAVVEGLLSGQTHVAELGPASYAMLRQRSRQFEPFAAFSNHNTLAQYHSVLLVAANSKAHSLQDLRGLKVALTDPASTSGAVIPRLAVRQLTGYGIEQFFGHVLYMGGHDKALAALRKGKVDAAFVASHQVGDFTGRALWRSPAITASPYVWDQRLCADLKQAIARVFLEQPARIQPWLETKNYRQMVPVTVQDYADIEAWLRAAQP